MEEKSPPVATTCPDPSTLSLCTTMPASLSTPSVDVTRSSLSASPPTAALTSLPVAMPAPKTQAAPRPRRVPAVDPSSLIPARRSSTRSIKRKKFDDELVESSLVKTERVRNAKTSGAGGSVGGNAVTSTPGYGLHGSSGVLQPLAEAADVTAGVPPSPLLIHPGGDASATGTVSPLVRGTVAPGTALDVSAAASSPTAVAMTTTVTPTGSTMAAVPSHLVPPAARTGKDIGLVGESGLSQPPSISSHPHSKPTAEKRSKLSSGKSVAASKGTGAGAGSGKGASSSRQMSAASKSSGTKASGSRSGMPKSKSRMNSRSKSKRSSRKQKEVSPAVKDLGRWKPHDDLALITAVQQTNDLSAVYTGVKFSCHFTLKEIEERWYALLYDPAISKIAMEAARQLHQDTVATIQGKALYSNAEEKLLGTIASGSQPTQETFQSILQSHPDVFHPARTAKTLHCHWMLMKQYHLLPDQTVQPIPRGDHILNLSDIEDFMNDEDIGEGEDEMTQREMALVDRRNKREIRHLEQEMPKWQVLVDSVTGISMPDFDNQTLGVLRGRLVRYLMRSREISLGRNTKDNHVDVDLSLEGPAWKISRRQGIIKLRNSGDFFIANEGKRPIIVDGKPVLCGNKQKLSNNSVVEISCLRFTFLINQDVINAVRADTVKPGVANTSIGT